MASTRASAGGWAKALAETIRTKTARRQVLIGVRASVTGSAGTRRRGGSILLDARPVPPDIGDADEEAQEQVENDGSSEALIGKVCRGNREGDRRMPAGARHPQDHRSLPFRTSQQMSDCEASDDED